MEHHEHVALIRDGILGAGPVWAELGSGEGAFTLALSDLLQETHPNTAANPARERTGEQLQIISIDRDVRALDRQRANLGRHDPRSRVTVTHLTADYREMTTLALPPLDGVLAANTLHFVRPKPRATLLRELWERLHPGGRIVDVEYKVDRGNLWVPHAFSYERWQRMAQDAGFREPRLLHTRPSNHLREIYGASAVKPLS